MNSIQFLFKYSYSLWFKVTSVCQYFFLPHKTEDSPATQILQSDLPIHMSMVIWEIWTPYMYFIKLVVSCSEAIKLSFVPFGLECGTYHFLNTQALL